MIPETVFSVFPSIQTERLTLRQPTLEDMEDVFAIKSDPSVTEPYCRKPYTGIGQAEKWIENLSRTYRARENIMWFITLRRTGL